MSNTRCYEPHTVISDSRGFIRSDKGFFVGDISYVLSSRLYYGLLGDELDYPTGVIHISGGDCIGVAYTGLETGVFVDNKDNRYCVDSGMLGIVPLELVKDERTDIGLIVPESGIVWFSHNFDGMFDFYLPPHTHIHLDTNIRVGL